jgi:hypothetical protein
MINGLFLITLTKMLLLIPCVNRLMNELLKEMYELKVGTMKRLYTEIISLFLLSVTVQSQNRRSE